MLEHLHNAPPRWLARLDGHTEDDEKTHPANRVRHEGFQASYCPYSCPRYDRTRPPGGTCCRTSGRRCRRPAHGQSDTVCRTCSLDRLKSNFSLNVSN